MKGVLGSYMEQDGFTSVLFQGWFGGSEILLEQVKI